MTDANLILGIIGEDRLMGDRIKLDKARAIEAVDSIAKPLGLSTVEAAYGIFTLINESMSDAIRLMTVQKGHDVREFSLVAIGGGGPLHASFQAASLDISTVIVPTAATAFSALGLLVSDLKISRSHAFLSSLDEMDLDALRSLVDDLRNNILADFGHKQEQVRFKFQLDLRYAGQTWELSTPLLEEEIIRADFGPIRDRFHSMHEQLYSFSQRHAPIEVINVHLEGIAPGLPFPADKSEYSETRVSASGRRPVYFGGDVGYVNTPIYLGQTVPLGQKIEGPCIIEETGTSIPVGVGQFCIRDSWGNYSIQRTSINNGKA